MLARLILAAGFVAMATPASAGWQIAQSKHFTVYSDDRPAEVMAFATRLERFDKAIRVALKLPDPGPGPAARVTIFVLPSLDDVRRVAGAQTVADIYRSQSPAGPVTFFPRRSPNDQTRRTPSPLMVLQHDYAQQILYATWGDTTMPAWLSEGFAEFFATARFRDNGGVILGTIPEYRWDGVDRANVFPVERLVRAGPDYADRQQAHVYAGRCWLLIHYIVFDPARARELDAYIAAVKSGKSADAAAQILGIEPALDLKLNAYGARPMWATAEFAADRLSIDAVTVRALTAGEAAMLPVTMRSRAGADATAAPAIAAQARALASPFADDAGAQNALATAEYDAGNYAASEAAADRALAADPGSVDAMVRKGMALVALARAGGAEPAAWAAARRWFQAANQADPSYFYPLQLHYAAFRAANEAPPEAAKKALLAAYRLNPANVGIRWEAARIFLHDGNAESARVALDPTLFGKHGGSLAALAKSVLVTLDAKGVPAALAAMNDS